MSALTRRIAVPVVVRSDHERRRTFPCRAGSHHRHRTDRAQQCDDACACTPAGLELVDQCLTCSVDNGAMTSDSAAEVAQGALSPQLSDHPSGVMPTLHPLRNPGHLRDSRAGDGPDRNGRFAHHYLLAHPDHHHVHAYDLRPVPLDYRTHQHWKWSRRRRRRRYDHEWVSVPRLHAAFWLECERSGYERCRAHVDGRFCWSSVGRCCTVINWVCRMVVQFIGLHLSA